MSTHHFEHSTYRAKLIEHLFVGGLLRCLWWRGIMDAELLKPEVDNGGYDLAIGYRSIIRHIQLKSSHLNAKARYQKVHLRLADRPGGCVVWIFFNENTLDLGPFLWFGGDPGEPLRDITDFPVAKHTKGNAQGTKVERPNIRMVKKKFFRKIDSIEELVSVLFGL